jgi:hypothetical protein
VDPCHPTLPEKQPRDEIATTTQNASSVEMAKGNVKQKEQNRGILFAAQQVAVT